MELWTFWWSVMLTLRPAFQRLRTFFWFVCAICGFSIRTDLMGVTSFIRCLGLKPMFYDRILDMFHSKGLDFRKLRKFWVKAVLKFGSEILWKVNGRIVLLGDGVKNPKSGKKMPGVKKLHQESESNTKPEYIFGHSLQSVSVVAKTCGWLTAIPLGTEIHEGVVFSNRCHKTLLDKMLELVDSLDITLPAYYVMDAYYGAEKMIAGALAAKAHLITRVRTNAVAWLIPEEVTRKRRGRKRKYGDKMKLSTVFHEHDGWTEAECLMYGVRTKVRFKSRIMLWRHAGNTVSFVFVKLENGKKAIFLSTDTTLSALEIIELYSSRFRIEVGFKTSIRVIGAMGYHFWMLNMKPIKREGKNQYMHMETDAYRDAVRRKLAAYHNFMQCGIIAHGTMTLLSLLKPVVCWTHFGSWMRTMQPEANPSEWVVAHAMRNTLGEFLQSPEITCNWAKFLLLRKEKNKDKTNVA